MCCVCCIIPGDTRENTMSQEQEDKDLSFVSFTCDWHAINPKVAESEIQHQNVWLRLLEIQRNTRRKRMN
jgi:hypothetical protein